MIKFIVESLFLARTEGMFVVCSHISTDFFFGRGGDYRTAFLRAATAITYCFMTMLLLRSQRSKVMLHARGMGM